jgi:hypothetical protein
MVIKILDDKSINLLLMLITVLESLRNYPTKYDIIFNYLEVFKKGNLSSEDLQSKENYIFFNNINLVYEINKIVKELFKEYSNGVISTII